MGQQQREEALALRATLVAEAASTMRAAAAACRARIAASAAVAVVAAALWPMPPPFSARESSVTGPTTWRLSVMTTAPATPYGGEYGTSSPLAPSTALRSPTATIRLTRIDSSGGHWSGSPLRANGSTDTAVGSASLWISPPVSMVAIVTPSHPLKCRVEVGETPGASDVRRVCPVKSSLRHPPRTNPNVAVRPAMNTHDKSNGILAH